MHVNEFTIVCTGRASHKKRELRQLTLFSTTVRDADSLDFEWADWEMSGARSRGTVSGGSHAVVARQPAEQGNASKPWRFSCAECSRLSGRPMEDLPYRIADSKLERLVRACLVESRFEFDISYWS